MLERKLHVDVVNARESPYLNYFVEFPVRSNEGSQSYQRCEASDYGELLPLFSPANSLASALHAEVSNPLLAPIASITVQNIAGMVPTKLTRHNYITWRNIFLRVLKQFKLLGLIDGTDVCPSQFVCDSAGLRVLNSAHDICLRAKIQTIQKGDSLMIDYLNSIKEISDKLVAAGEPIFKSDLVAYILSGLPDDYESFVDSIETRNESITSDELHGLLLSKEISFQKRKTRLTASNTFTPFHALTAQSSTTSGHHSGFRGNYRGPYSPMAMTAVHQATPNYWIIDSGASHHVTPNPSSLNSAIPYTSNEQLFVGDGKAFDPFGFYIKDLRTGKMLFQGPSEGGLYPFYWNASDGSSRITVSPRALMVAKADISLWHRRLGHPSNAVLHSVLRTHHLPVTGSVNKLSICAACQMGKASKLPFFVLPCISVKLFHLVHADESASLDISHAPSMYASSLSVTDSSIEEHVSPTAPHNTHPMITQAKAGICKPKIFTATKHHFPSSVDPLTKILSTPTTYLQASKHASWRAAMKAEFQALQSIGTWDLVPHHPSYNLVSCKWVFKVKHKADGSIERYKARLVAKDVSNAFLHGYLKEDVYMLHPPGFVDVSKPTHVCKLKRSLYGLKQAPRAWYEAFYSAILSLGFSSSTSDTSLFIKKDTTITFILVYVDDIIITGSSSSVCQTIISQLQTLFPVKNLGDIHYFLGIEVQRSSKGLFLHQSKYALDLLKKTDMLGAKPSSIPVSSSKLDHFGALLPDPTSYRSIVGALQYLTWTRLDLAFAVNQVCQHMQAPRTIHLQAVKRILRYLKGTIDLGLWFTKGHQHLTAWSDADWVGCPVDRRSTSGYCVFLGSNLVAWSAKKQNTVARSSIEAEYRSLANSAAEVTWICKILSDISFPLLRPPVIFYDNKSAITLAFNPVFHARTKHVEIDYHFIREKILLCQIGVQHVGTLSQIADIFTKSLHAARFASLADKLSEGVADVVRDGWEYTVEGSPMFQVTEKIKMTRMMLNRWARSNVGTRPVEIREVEDKLTSLLGHSFLKESIAQKKELIGKLNRLLGQKEQFLRQRSKENWLKLGDRNHGLKYP
ncbi:uncharacterized protein [Malus domestica]|uniref:uncharacterized protein n=1 Tax=Malus domestica TaxID=3750 RepID=UPI00397608A2